MLRKISLPAILCFVALLQGKAQNNGNGGQALLIHFNYGIQMPGGDLAERFGRNAYAGGGLSYLTGSNWQIGLESGILFGTNVDEDPLLNLRTPEGFIYGNNKSQANVQLRQRGLIVLGSVGKIIGLSNRNPRAGLKIALGVGLLQHKIRIQEDPESFVPQIAGDYKKGYDNLSNGLVLHQFIGYQLLGRSGRTNFFIGVEAAEAFTQNRRTTNFATFAPDPAERTDILWGIRIGWIIPLYLGNGDEIWY